MNTKKGFRGKGKKKTPDLIFKIDLMCLCYFIIFLTGIIYI